MASYLQQYGGGYGPKYHNEYEYENYGYDAPYGGGYKPRYDDHEYGYKPQHGEYGYDDYHYSGGYGYEPKPYGYQPSYGRKPYGYKSNDYDYQTEGDYTEENYDEHDGGYQKYGGEVNYEYGGGYNPGYKVMLLF